MRAGRAVAARATAGRQRGGAFRSPALPFLAMHRVALRGPTALGESRGTQRECSSIYPTVRCREPEEWRDGKGIHGLLDA
jgi:hypothetical protein